MEVEESSQSEEKSNVTSNSQLDVDSGIENMEVEEAKEATPQRVGLRNQAFAHILTSSHHILWNNWNSISIHRYP